MATKQKTQRVNFASAKLTTDYPDFLDIQIKSFQDFFQLETKSDERSDEGLYKTFLENFPITDTRNNFVLEFLDYFVDPPRYSIQECIERGLTYSVPLKARLKLYCTDPEHEDFETIVQDVYLGVIPFMTHSGTFVINGAERVVVSQLHRSPGVFFGQSFHANGTKLYSARVIPFKGSWIEFATDINQVMFAYIDRKKKLPVTTLFRAIGFERDKDILEIFDLAEEVKVTKTGLKKVLGRKLAARVLKTWFEDFVDEDYTILDETVMQPWHQDPGVIFVKNPVEYRIVPFGFGDNRGWKYDPNGKSIASVEELEGPEMGFRSRESLILLGQTIYAHEGCWYCHTDQTRTLVEDTVLNGSESYPAPPSSPNEYIYQKVTFPGTRRIGPDMSRVGIKRPSRDWHKAHFWAPRTASAGSIMPSFRHFFDFDPRGTRKTEVGIPNYRFEAIYQYLMTKGTRITPPTEAWWLGKDPVQTLKIIEGEKGG